MLPAAALAGQHVTGEIELMQALHNNDLYALGRIIDAAAKRSIKAQIHRFPFHLADGLLRVERIVKNENVTTHARGRGLQAGGKHSAAVRIFIMAFYVLITREPEDAAPLFLVPL